VSPDHGARLAGLGARTRNVGAGAAGSRCELRDPGARRTRGSGVGDRAIRSAGGHPRLQCAGYDDRGKVRSGRSLESLSKTPPTRNPPVRILTAETSGAARASTGPHSFRFSLTNGGGPVDETPSYDAYQNISSRDGTKAGEHPGLGAQYTAIERRAPGIPAPRPRAWTVREHLVNANCRG